MIVTIDGPAGSGKSTVSKLLADEFSLYQVDSGAFYRFYTHLAILYSEKNRKTIQEFVDTPDFLEYIHNQKPDVIFEAGRQVINYRGENMEKYIRLPVITASIKHIADHRSIREEVNRRISEISLKYPVIADGRDMGTVVFPNADFKIFLTASLETRARRRMNEFKASNSDITLEEVIQQIDKRDKEDEKREFGKLEAAKDAIFVDTTDLEINGVVQLIAKIIQSKNKPEN